MTGRAEPSAADAGLAVSPQRRATGSLGSRLVVAFLLVVGLTLGLVGLAALIGTGRGIDATSAEARQRVADSAAAALRDAYVAAGGWAGADLGPARAVATDAGARLVVVPTDGTAATPGPAGGWGAGGGMGPGMSTDPSSGMGSGMGAGMGAGMSSGSVVARVVVDGVPVGNARVVFGMAAATAARQVAWRWIALAGVASLALAGAVAWLVTVRIARPLSAVAGAARAFAAGDREARADVDAPGEIGEVGRALDDMAAHVVRSEAARQRAAADVAHELRTPLAALQAGLEEIRDGLEPPDPQRLAALHDQSLRLGRIVDDLGALAAAEGGALSLRRDRLDLADVVLAEVTAHEPRLRAAEVSVTVAAEPVTVLGDADRLRQVVGNLLANVARYARPGDDVRVLVGPGDPRTGRAGVDPSRPATPAAAGQPVAHVVVADTGPGITAEELSHVFDRLWRGRAGDRVRGSGIGLAVVRELVVAHGGTITVSSDGRSGTTFTMLLPAQE